MKEDLKEVKTQTFELSYENKIYNIYIEYVNDNITIKTKEYSISINLDKIEHLSNLFIDKPLIDIYCIFLNEFKNNKVQIINIIQNKHLTLLFFPNKENNFKLDLLFNKNAKGIISNPYNIKLAKIISNEAYGTSLDNVFITFKSKSDILYIIFSNLKKSIIAYDLNILKIVTEIKNAHKDYIDNFRYAYDVQNKRDIILSLSSGDNNIKIWDVKNWNCLNSIILYKIGIILSACFLCDKNFNYIITCNCFLYNIIVTDFKGNKIKEINESNNHTLFIDLYYDNQKNKYYIITGNRFNFKSYDYNNNTLYNIYSDNFSSNHRSGIVYDDDGIIKILFGCEEGYIRIFNFHNANLLNRINVNNEALVGICLWNKDYLFVGSKNKTMKLVDLKKEKILNSIEGHNHWICSIKMNINLVFGQCLITQGLDNKIKLWKIEKIENY